MILRDSKTRLSSLKQLVGDFVSARNWKMFHNPKNLSMAITAEAAELMDLFKWVKDTESSETLKLPAMKRAMAGELADVIIYILAMATATGLDISEIVTKRLARDRRKYPVRKYKGQVRLVGRRDNPS